MTTTLETRKPFAYQAAKFALWAPVTVFFIGLVFRGAMENAQESGDQGTLKAIGWIMISLGITLELTAAGLAIYALAAVRRLGAKGLLVRSIIGLALALIFLVSMTSLWMTPQITHLRRTLVGNWKANATAPDGRSVTMLMGLRANGSASWETQGNEIDFKTTGDWQVSQTAKGLYLLTYQIQKSTPKDLPVDKLTWGIGQLNATRAGLVERGADGKMVTVTYERVAD